MDTLKIDLTEWRVKYALIMWTTIALLTVIMLIALPIKATLTFTTFVGKSQMLKTCSGLRMCRASVSEVRSN